MRWQRGTLPCAALLLVHTCSVWCLVVQHGGHGGIRHPRQRLPPRHTSQLAVSLSKNADAELYSKVCPAIVAATGRGVASAGSPELQLAEPHRDDGDGNGDSDGNVAISSGGAGGARRESTPWTGRTTDRSRGISGAIERHYRPSASATVSQREEREQDQQRRVDKGLSHDMATVMASLDNALTRGHCGAAVQALQRMQLTQKQERGTYIDPATYTRVIQVCATRPVFRERV